MQPREYQTETLNKTWEYLTKHKTGRPVIVLPTGAGKSWVIALLIHRAREYGGRVLTLAHRKELLKQNAEKIEHLLDDTVGIYSAGLNQRDTDHDVLVAGIQSVYKRGEDLGERNLIIVDEAHLISSVSQSMYQTLFESFPDARYVGLTGTPYRCGEGPIAGKGRVFSRVCHEVGVAPLVDLGFLSPLTYRPTTEIDTTKLKIRAGEYIPGEMQKLFGAQPVVERACLEIAVLSKQRKSVLVFCSGVSHAAYVREQLEKITGEQVGLVTGDTIPMERTESLHRFSTGSMRIMCNCDVLTTGFDNPRIDCIAILRATLSPGLFAQMAGRGFRISEEKTDCLILDFGGNRIRHGSPDDADYGRLTGGEPVTSAEVAAAKNSRGRECLNCQMDIPVGEAKCHECGYVIPLSVRHEESCDQQDVVRWDVVLTSVGKHIKRNATESPPTMRVDYQLTEDGSHGNLVGTSASEWVCFEHTGYARTKAVKWWRERSNHPVPATVDDAVDLVNRHGVRMPAKLSTEQDGKYRRVLKVIFREQRPDVDQLQEHATVEGWGCEVPF